MGTPNRRDHQNSGSPMKDAMTLIRIFLSGLKALLRKSQRSLELDEELRSYLDAAAADKMRRGERYTEAIRAARVEMGSFEAIKQEVRSSGWESAVESLWQDIHYGARQMIRNPGLSIIVILTLALGIGANTAIFSLLDAVILRVLPVKDAEELVYLTHGAPGRPEFSYPAFRQIRDLNQ